MNGVRFYITILDHLPGRFSIQSASDWWERPKWVDEAYAGPFDTLFEANVSLEEIRMVSKILES